MLCRLHIKRLPALIFGIAFFLATFAINQDLGAAQHAYSTISYTKKAPYAGYGKPSKLNGLPKTKIISGHIKKTSKGITHVDPYARSK